MPDTVELKSLVAGSAPLATDALVKFNSDKRQAQKTVEERAAQTAEGLFPQSL